MIKIYSITLVAFATIMFSFAQAPHFQLYEHFTQASCGPCAAQNPGFQDSILNPFPDIVRHVAYHTSWPGVDPMYNLSPSGVNNRVAFYTVSGVPFVELDGNVKSGGPGNFTRQDVENAFSKTSPVKIIVSHSDAAGVRTVNVEVKVVGAIPTGNYRLRTLLIERLVQYTVAPGNNGETEFPNVYRAMLPDTAGENITLPAIGSSLNFTYNINHNSAWVLSQIAEIAFLQRLNDKEVINTGSSFDPIINTLLVTPTKNIKNGLQGSTVPFAMTVGNSGSASESFTYTLTTNAPANWNASFILNGLTYTSSTSQLLTSNSNLPLTVNVVPGNTPAIAKYTLKIQSVNNPTSPAMSTTFYVVSGVRDLVVSNNAGKGDGTGGTASTWEGIFTQSLSNAGATMMTSTTSDVLENAMKSNAMTGIKNIYFNCGWTFPAFTDSMAMRYENFMNAGGNVFMSGQDIAWEVFDSTNTANTYTTAYKRNFMRHHMNVDFVNDGFSSSITLSPIATDEIFNAATTGTISNFYGGTYFFPDELKLYGIGKSIFYYNTAQTKIAGIRAYNSIHKTVFIAPGMEMLDATKAAYILSQSYKWFNGMVSIEEFDNNMIGNLMPNPANTEVNIPLNNVNSNIEIIDVNGKVLITEQASNNNFLKVDVSTLASGIYFVRLKGSNNVNYKKLIIQK